MIVIGGRHWEDRQNNEMHKLESKVKLDIAGLDSYPVEQKKTYELLPLPMLILSCLLSGA